jgi:hypothetical protein
MSDIMEFANEITYRDLGVMASCVMNDCEKFGMTYGCTINCPVLQDGKCELQDYENKELYNEFLETYGGNK